MFPPAPASLSDPSGQAADGGALPGMSEWPLPGATGARGAVSPSHDARSAGGIPLHRQPLAPPGGQLGDHATQSLSQNESSQVSTWIRGPPVASPVEQSVDINRRPVRSPAVGIGRGMRNVRSMADAIHPECIRASHGRSSTLARDPPGGTPVSPIIRERAPGRVFPRHRPSRTPGHTTPISALLGRIIDLAQPPRGSAQCMAPPHVTAPQTVTTLTPIRTLCAPHTGLEQPPPLVSHTIPGAIPADLMSPHTTPPLVPPRPRHPWLPQPPKAAMNIVTMLMGIPPYPLSARGTN